MSDFIPEMSVNELLFNMNTWAQFFNYIHVSITSHDDDDAQSTCGDWLNENIRINVEHFLRHNGGCFHAEGNFGSILSKTFTINVLKDTSVTSFEELVLELAFWQALRSSHQFSYEVSLGVKNFASGDLLNPAVRHMLTQLFEEGGTVTCRANRMVENEFASGEVLTINVKAPRR